MGLSILSGAHMTLVPKVVALLREQGADDVIVTVGGTIPADDVPELKELGVAEVFTPGSPTDDIVGFVRDAVSAKASSRSTAPLSGCSSRLWPSWSVFRAVAFTAAPTAGLTASGPSSGSGRRWCRAFRAWGPCSGRPVR